MKEWKDIFSEKLLHWWYSFLKIMPEMILALLVMVLAINLGRLVRRALMKLVLRMSGKLSFANLFARISQLVILFTGLFIALDVLQLNKALSSLLAGAGIIGIILGFAFQDITSNFISGIYIALKKPFDIGHTIKTNDFIGNVEAIHLRSTTIRTFSGLHLMIPNRDIIQKPLINYSLTQERRIELEFYIDAASDLEKAFAGIHDGISRLEYTFPGKHTEIYFTDFKENSIKVAVWFWIDNHGPPGYMKAKHDAILHIMGGLRKKSVTLMVPVSLRNFEISQS